MPDGAKGRKWIRRVGGPTFVNGQEVPREEASRRRRKYKNVTDAIREVEQDPRTGVDRTRRLPPQPREDEPRRAPRWNRGRGFWPM